MEKQKQSICECNFCGKNQGDLILEGKTLFKSLEYKSAVCSDCTQTLIKGNETPIQIKKRIKDFVSGEFKKNNSNLTPKEIFDHISKTVKGQESAVRAVSAAVSGHLSGGDFGIKKSNVLIVGPSGSGKTQIARAIQTLGIPVVVYDATALTTAGYVGDSVDSILNHLLVLTKGNLDQAHRGVIFIDEIDKKSDRGPSSGDIGTRMVQDALLKLIEGGIFHLTYNKESVVVDTSKILFICAGAFSGLTRNKQKTRVGLSSLKQESADYNQVVSREKLVQYGMSPELIRRFSVITSTRDHTKESLNSIVFDGESSLLKAFERKLTVYEITPKVSRNLIDSIIDKSLKSEVPVALIEEFFEELYTKIVFHEKFQKNTTARITNESEIEFKRKTKRN